VENPKYITSCRCFLMSLGFTILSVIHVVPMMTGFLNPEFGVKQLLKSIKIYKIIKI
jgi:hypothetical protein